MATQQVTPPAGESHSPVAGSQTQQPTAGNIGITAEEVERRLAEARRDEKAKLYPDLEKSKEELKKKERELADAKAALEAAQAEGKKAKTLEEQVSQLTKQVEGQADQFSKAIDDALERQQKAFEETSRKDRLATKREALLSSTTELIPAMVTGNTPEELQQSFERSKAEFKRIQDAAIEKARQELGAPLRDALPKPVTPGGEAGSTAPGSTEGGLESWRHFTPQEWEQKRADIKRQAFASVGLPMRNR